MPRPEKVARVERIAEKFKESKNVFVADYTGLTVIDITDLRKQLREKGVTFRVEKNTLLRLAAKEAGWDKLLPELKGPTAIALSADDPAEPAKILHEFYDRLEKPVVRMFQVDDHPYGPDDLKALAKLPPREILLSQLVAAVESPITGLVGTLDAIIRDFVMTIEAIIEKKENEGDTPPVAAEAEAPAAEAEEAPAAEAEESAKDEGDAPAEDTPADDKG
jgi:large subunit ribosomal protein L10